MAYVSDQYLQKRAETTVNDNNWEKLLRNLKFNCHFRDAEVSDCGKYLLVTMYEGLRDNLLYIADLEEIGEITGKIPLTPIITEFNADYEVLQTNFSQNVVVAWKLMLSLNSILVHHEHWIENGFPYE